MKSDLPCYLGFQFGSVRSALLPVFTLKQGFFLTFFVGIAVLLALTLQPPFSIAMPSVLVAAAVGALSVSSPAYLVTGSCNTKRVHEMLLDGGWIDGHAGWHRYGTWLTQWENDFVQIYNGDRLMLVEGPFYTLQRLRRGL